MNGSDILFSVVIPTHNRPDMLTKAVDSVLKSKALAIEIIVINDGSAVPYLDFTDTYNEKIIYHTLPTSRGVSFARNYGVSYAKGSWIVFLDDDDELHPGYLEKLAVEIQQPSSRRCADFIWANVMTNNYQDDAQPIKNIIDFSQFNDSVSNLELAASTIGCSYGFSVKADLFRRAGGFDTAFEQGEDTELIIRLLSMKAMPGVIASIGVIKHNHTYNRLTSSFSDYSNNEVYEKIANRHSIYLKNHPKIYASMLIWSMQVHYQNCYYSLGHSALLKLFCLRCFCLPHFLAVLQIIFFRVKKKIYSLYFDKSATIPSQIKSSRLS